MEIDEAEVERRVERFKEAARQTGIKLTYQRLVIFRELASSLDHPNAEAIFKAVKPKMQTVSLDTVYRTLWMLNDLGLAATLGPKRESVRFDANLSHHHHFICVRCGLARDFSNDEFDLLGTPESVREFGEVIGTHVEVRGICKACVKEQSGKPET